VLFCYNVIMLSGVPFYPTQLIDFFEVRVEKKKKKIKEQIKPLPLSSELGEKGTIGNTITS